MNAAALIRLEPGPQAYRRPHFYEVYYVNGARVGEFYMEVDGFYVYAPEKREGYITEHLLLALGMKLKELNAEWEQQIEKDLK